MVIDSNLVKRPLVNTIQGLFIGKQQLLATFFFSLFMKRGKT